MWYCTHCKEHVRAMKTVCLWRHPNILVVHLKRFEYRDSFSREKIGVLVDFPLEGLDLGKHAASDSSDFVVDVTPAVYDLFGGKLVSRFPLFVSEEQSFSYHSFSNLSHLNSDLFSLLK